MIILETGIGHFTKQKLSGPRSKQFSLLAIFFSHSSDINIILLSLVYHLPLNVQKMQFEQKYGFYLLRCSSFVGNCDFSVMFMYIYNLPVWLVTFSGKFLFLSWILFYNGHSDSVFTAIFTVIREISGTWW